MYRRLTLSISTVALTFGALSAQAGASTELADIAHKGLVWAQNQMIHRGYALASSNAAEGRQFWWNEETGHCVRMNVDVRNRRVSELGAARASACEQSADSTAYGFTQRRDDGRYAHRHGRDAADPTRNEAEYRRGHDDAISHQAMNDDERSAAYVSGYNSARGGRRHVQYDEQGQSGPDMGAWGWQRAYAHGWRP